MRRSFLLLLALLLVVVTVGSTVAAQSVAYPDLANDRHRLPANLAPAVRCLSTDLDLDGDMDLLRQIGTGAVQWLLQDQAGRFVVVATSEPSNVAVAGEVVDIAVGVFDLDKYPDLVVGQRNGAITLIPNTGKGMPGKAVLLPALSGVLRPVVAQLVAGDVDRVNNTDLFVILNGSAPQYYLTDGRGGFGKAVALTPSPSLSSPFGLLADLDLDGFNDLLVVSGDVRTPSVPLLWQNLGSKGFTLLGSAFSTKIAASCGAITDFTGDKVPDILLAPALATASPPILFQRGKTLVYAPATTSGGLKLLAPRRIVPTDLNADGYPDLMALNGGGGLVFGRNRGQSGPGLFDVVADPLPGGGHSCLLPFDVEGDGDLDIYLAGNGVEDSLLLHDGKGRYIDTEAWGMPIGVAVPHFGVLTDLLGTPDEDLLLFDATGRPQLLHNQFGQARFELSSATTAPVAVPALPATTYLDAQSLAVQGAGARVDVLVHGVPTAADSRGVRILVRRLDSKTQRYYLADETATRFDKQVPLVRVLAADLLGGAKSAGAAGFDDLIGIDGSGNLLVYANAKGTFSGTPLLLAKQVSATSRIHVADLNADSLRDVILINAASTRVLLGQSAVADTFAEQVTIKIGGGAALITELTGDRYDDILYATSNTKLGLQLLVGDGKGGFGDASSKYLPAAVVAPADALPLAKAVDLAVLKGGAIVAGVPSTKDLTVLIAIPGANDYAMTKNDSGIFVQPRPLPFRGSRESARLIVSDLDKDGDADLLTIRGDGRPQLLMGQETQLTQMGITQHGRDLRVKFRMPNLTTQAVLGFGGSVLSLDVRPFGVLRVNNPAPILYVGPKTTHAEIASPTLPNGTFTSVPLQIFLLDFGANTLRFGNLEIFEFTNY